VSTVAIVDYGMCNLDSIRRAVEECGGSPQVTGDPKDLERAARIIIPGVGSFSEAAGNLKKLGLADAIREQVRGKQIPLLGICLGMQLLATRGEEGGESEGLGLIDGDVVKLAPAAAKERVPHVGWNEVRPVTPHPLFQGISPGKDFYFVHSFHLRPRDAKFRLASTPYCGEFASAVVSDNVLGVQFHPEKSQRVGFQLLKNFLSW
jgi:glutamine amidotransferase